MKYLLIMNPGSRSGKGKKLWQTWESALTQAGVDYNCIFTEQIGHAVDIARNTIADVVVAVGGDGTINEVLDGVLQSQNPDIRMGVLYSGTSPDFCKFHKIPINPAEAVKSLLQGNIKKVDVARITYHNESGKDMTAHFGCSCNIGMGASIARFANNWRRYLGDTIGTGAGVILALARNASVDIDLKIDGVIKHLNAVNNLTIAKNYYIASGLKLNLKVKSDDGELVIFGINEKSRLEILKILPGFYSGSVASADGVFVDECRTIEISSKVKQEIEFDGDPRGYLPAKIEILPKVLNLIGGTDE